MEADTEMELRVQDVYWDQYFWKQEVESSIRQTMRQAQGRIIQPDRSSEERIAWIWANWPNLCTPPLSYWIQLPQEGRGLRPGQVILELRPLWRSWQLNLSAVHSPSLMWGLSIAHPCLLHPFPPQVFEPRTLMREKLWDWSLSMVIQNTYLPKSGASLFKWNCC